jgi:4-hydroxybenzoate polyprenyltransferase
MIQKKILIYARAFRVNQWIKNLVVFTAILFSGNLFDLNKLGVVIAAFIVFCLLSSATYLLNDIIDYSYDIKHPSKKHRPIAAGLISIPEATFIVFLLALGTLLLAIFFSHFTSYLFFILCLAFILLNFFYSLYLKKQPVIDIFAISFSFMIRTFVGEVVSGYHIPIWLLLTIFYGSLFMASVKRHAEFVVQGAGTRESLEKYKSHLIDFLTYIFATATILAYSTYTYSPDATSVSSVRLLAHVIPNLEARKWMMVSIPFVVYGIARYAQLLYEKAQGERPEQVITTDIPLVVTIISWGLIIIGLIYVF